MTLKIVNNDLTKEVHSVRIDDGVITVIAIEDGSDVKISEMEELFPYFKEIIDNATNTVELLATLQQTNDKYIWAHVSGKI
ncbi:hypothetical protein [Acinetobacter lwoffii]|uniref:hypothetical protein n=1 Tax=Acinetobacter lwoffii TaxID=28090 RepID=UPI0012DF5582|nr:hypothetical protein [Acinetobacter lwoffii]QGR75593.1 hypothetical protein FOB21_13645 [Acinetobacter lwoffii]